MVFKKVGPPTRRLFAAGNAKQEQQPEPCSDDKTTAGRPSGQHGCVQRQRSNSAAEADGLRATERAAARAVADQAGGGNRGALSGARSTRRAGGAGGQDAEQEQESGVDELVHSISTALTGGRGSATESLASLQNLLGRLVQIAQNEATGPWRTGNQDSGPRTEPSTRCRKWWWSTTAGRAREAGWRSTSTRWTAQRGFAPERRRARRRT